MSADVEDPPIQTAASLVSGILSDLQRLVKQQFQLTRREIEAELRQFAAAASVVGLGLGILFLAAMTGCLSLSHLLHWLASSSGADPAWIPLWGCHAVVATALFAIGGIVAQVGRANFRSIDPCRNPATEILQEHAPWTTPPR